MKLFETKHLIAALGVLALTFTGCASGGSNKPEAQQEDQQIEAPKTISGSDKDLYTQALKAQTAGQFESAIKLWEKFLSSHPDSFEGHNNLGLVYYTQDMLEQALQEFETAYRLEPADPIIRRNLARALRFKAAMIHESRDYFKTLKILARLEKIVEPEEKQAILFKQEQVEDQIFLQVIKANNSASYQDFVNRFPDGLNAVRAREYLAEHPTKRASKSTSQNKVSKSTSKGKSWISSGKAVKNPTEGTPWGSSDQAPDYASSRPTATYTPPPAGAKKKKEGDFFGTDSDAVEEVTEENVGAAQEMDPVAAIPFEDFEKPERSSGEQATAKAADEGKESLRVADEFNATDGEPDGTAAGLDTLPDLTPSPVVVVPAEMDAPQSTDTFEEAIEQASKEEAIEKALEAESAESENEQMTRILKEEIPAAETAQPEPVQPETAQEVEIEPQASPAEEKSLEVAGSSESVESESDRIARIVREQIAAENEESEPVQPEPVEEIAAEPQAIPEEQPMEVAGFGPGDQDVKQEIVPAESAPAEEPAPDPEEKQNISQETISETVAALVPTLPQPNATETAAPAESVDSSKAVVVVQMSGGSTLNVRANPSAQGEILGYLEDGDMMPFISESGDWYQIEIEEGLSGWISKKYSTTRSVAVEASSPEPGDDMTGELASLEPEQSSGAKEGAIVIVTVSEGSTLNVRSIPSPSGAVVDMLFGGDKLPLVKEENGWYLVLFEDETTGWISKKFSVIEGETPVASPATVPEAALPVPKEKKAPWGAPVVKAEKKEMITTVVVIKVPEGSSLNVRSAPSSQGQVLGSLKRGDMRPLLEENDEWYQVELRNGQSGWVSQKFSGKMSLDSSFVESP